MDNPENLLITEYGWIVFIIYIVIRDIIPGLVKFFTNSQEEQADHSKLIDQRYVEALEKVANSTTATQTVMETMKVMVESTNLRLASLENHSQALLTGMELLLDRIGLPGTRPITQPTPSRRKSASSKLDIDNE